MTFLDNGWTEEQAQGLLDKLKLTGGTPNWKPEHIQKLRDWCRALDKDDTAIDSQLECRLRTAQQLPRCRLGSQESQNGGRSAGSGGPLRETVDA